MHSVGVIGYGVMGSYHADAIIPASKVAIVAGSFDIKPERQAEIAKKGYITYTSLEDLFNDKAIDIVLIATPNNFHKDLAIKALQAGKHVICEKPATLNIGELEEIIAIQKKTGRLFSVHQNRRLDEDFVTIKQQLTSGTIGVPYYIESRVQGSKGMPGDWRSNKESGGGMLLDWGVHLIDQMLLLCDEPITEVYSQLMSVNTDEVDDNFKLLLRFANGLSSLIEVDTNCFIALPRWHISGKYGTMCIKNWGERCEIKRPKNTVYFNNNFPTGTSSGPTRTMAPRNEDSIESFSVPLVSTDCSEYYRNFVSAIEGKAELSVKLPETVRVMRIIDAAFESSASGHSINGVF